jgi:hypothetical protein
LRKSPRINVLPMYALLLSALEHLQREFFGKV